MRERLHLEQSYIHEGRATGRRDRRSGTSKYDTMDEIMEAMR